MRYLILGALGMIMTAYGLSDGLAQLGGNPGRVVGWLGVAVTAVAAYFQYREAQPFELYFTEQSWRKHGEREHSLSVEPSRHKKGTAATAVIYMENDGGFEQVECLLQTIAGGTVEAQTSHPFKGKLIVK